MKVVTDSNYLALMLATGQCKGTLTYLIGDTRIESITAWFRLGSDGHSIAFRKIHGRNWYLGCSLDSVVSFID